MSKVSLHLFRMVDNPDDPTGGFPEHRYVEVELPYELVRDGWHVVGEKLVGTA